MNALSSVTLAGLAAVILTTDLSQEKQPKKEAPIQLGNFSVSLNVKDIKASKAFYDKLGFIAVMGDVASNWLIMQNGPVVIGLFQGMFARNTLTFNPGWDNKAQKLNSFTDVRELQRELKAQGVTFIAEADTTTKGLASFMIADPDGNPILVDQHV